MTFLFYFALVLFVLLSLVLGLVILIQESKSLGLGASFGGDAGSSMFGTSTADIVKKITGWLAIIFVIMCITLSFWCSRMGKVAQQRASGIEQVEMGAIEP